MKTSEEKPTVVMTGRTARMRPDLVPLYALAAAVLCAAGGWYLLKELAPLLRPLILAVFLAYTILPAHRALCRSVSAKLSGPLLALLVSAVVLGLAVVIFGNLMDLKNDRPDRRKTWRNQITPHRRFPQSLGLSHRAPDAVTTR
jgi:predicted PurR-regulated permease PerM